ncbi:hypothetical protein Taro_050767, partial [Colocasia esculenta]|nr:hypothetical protein [Colocasia esculenta]
ALLELQDTGARLRRERETLRNTLNYCVPRMEKLVCRSCSAHVRLLSMECVTAVTSIICPVVDVFKNDIYAKAKEEFKCVFYLKDKMNGISDLVETIKRMDEDAEKKQLQDKVVRKWVRDRKNAGYDMEDVLCDYRVMVSTEDGQRVATRWMGRAKDGLYLACGIPLSCCVEINTPRIEIARRLRSIHEKLDGINQRKAELNLVQHSGGGSNESDATASRETTALEDKERPMIGRNELKTEIKEALLNSSRARTSKLSIVCIVGVGGMGKTTLAQNIFNDEDVKAAFSLMKWLYVGDKFDCQGLLKKVIGNSGQHGDLNDLHLTVAEKMKNESFLIVLDDAWLDNGEEWGRFLRPLSQGDKGGAIIVTSRNSAVGTAIPHRTKKLYELEQMSDAECMEIFKSWAFMGQEAETYPDLKHLSEKVVRKLKGVPLAASMVGGFLGKHLHDRRQWINVAEVGWPHADKDNVVDGVVGLSYLHLPSHLKLCFAYCAMFPKGFRFRKETMVRMWIAQGYVEKPLGNELMEHIGSDYFNELCQRSFLQLQSHEFYGDHYIMHDLIHDFAVKVFTEGLQVGASDTEDGASSEEIRHLSVYCSETEPPKLKILDNCKKLRTLIVESDLTIATLPTDVFANFRYLRLLILNVDELSEFPDSIRHSQFLQYLDISRTKIRALPELVCDLVNLLFFILPDPCALPEGMNKLINLRFIKVGDERVPQFEGIGQLTSLQQLSTFKVENKSGWMISELGGLNHLHGKLVVSGLQNVTHKKETKQAHLEKKVHLEELLLDWSEFSSVQREHVVAGKVQKHLRNDEESQVLEGLLPPPHLKVLKIRKNRGARFPSWMEERCCPSLVRLELDGCCNWECLPSTLGRFPSLKELRIRGASSVKKIGPEFYGGTGESGGGYFRRLEILELEEMSAWEEWEMPTGEINSGGGGRHVFPSLKELWIDECPKLLTLSPVLRHLTNLKELKVYNCPKLASFSAMLRHLTALEDLTIGGCDQLVLDGGVAEDDTEDEATIFSSEQQPVVDSQVDQEENVINDVVEIREIVEGQSPSPYLNKSLTLKNKRGAQLQRWTKNKHHRLLLSSLVTLRLDGCCNWECLPTLGHLPSLEELTIVEADHVKKIGPKFYGETDVYFPRLEILELKEMSAWEEWDMPAGEMEGGGRPSHLFPSLKELRIVECPKLPSLSPVLRHLTSLKSITISRCAELAFLLEEERDDECGWLLPSLQRLNIEECPKLASLSPILRHSSNLEWIEIKKCVVLASLEEGDDECRWMLPSLWFLSIEECPKLASLSPILRHSSNVMTIEIKKCAELASLEEGDGECGWMLPSLKYLIIQECPKLASLSPILRHSSNLKQIQIKKCAELALLSSEEGNGECGWMFPSLEYLSIEECPKLASLSPILRHSSNLEWIEIKKCAELALSSEEGNGECGWMFPSLEYLSIEECPKLASLSPILRHSSNLKWIEIKKCAELALLSSEEGDGECGLMLPSLKWLSIDECPKLAFIPPILQIKKCAVLALLSSEEGDDECGRMLPSLEELTIEECGFPFSNLAPKLLPSLSQMLPRLTALHYLHIGRFRNLQCLPPCLRNLRSLSYLTIEDCPAVECLPDGGLPPSFVGAGDQGVSVAGRALPRPPKHPHHNPSPLT